MYVEWSPPQENPQCVHSYRIDWKENSATLQMNETSITLENLEACDSFSVSVIALSEVLPPLNRLEESVQTQAIGKLFNTS